MRIVYAVCALYNFLLLGGVEPSDRDEEEGLTDKDKAVLEEAYRHAVHHIDQKGADELRRQKTDHIWARHEAHQFLAESEDSDASNDSDEPP